jgi:hypothetical protein
MRQAAINDFGQSIAKRELQINRLMHERDLLQKKVTDLQLEAIKMQTKVLAIGLSSNNRFLRVDMLSTGRLVR